MLPSAGICKFYDQDIRSGLKHKRILGQFINEMLFYYLKKSGQINYIFVSDNILLEMNQQHLQHDTYTDIITFDLSDTASHFILADIYISVERVRENAARFNVDYSTELTRVILHGARHLCGFSDKTKKQQAIMREKENEWMNQYFLRLKT